MKIGVILDNEFNDDSRVRREVEVFRKAGHSVFILCYGFDGKKYSEVNGVTISRIRMKKRTKNILFFLFNLLPLYEKIWSSNVKKFIIGNQIDILHVHDLYMSKASRQGITKSGKQVPMILDLHENFPYAIEAYNWTRGFLRKLLSQPVKWKKKEKKYLAYADKLIVLSNHFKNQLVKKYGFLSDKKIFIYPNFPDLERLGTYPIVQLDSIKINPPILLYFGVIAERRGIFDILDALEKLLNNGYNANLLCIGPADKADYKKFQKYLNNEVLKEHIQYIPWIDISELPSVMNISDIGLAPFLKNPQHDSGVANKIYQYMFGKLPIVASDCLPQKELIETYNCGAIYSNKKELLGALIKLLDTKDLRIQLGNNGFNALLSKIEIQGYNKSLLEALKFD